MLADFTGDFTANKAVLHLDQMRREAVRDARHVERHWSSGLVALAVAWSLGLATAVLASLV